MFRGVVCSFRRRGRIPEECVVSVGRDFRTSKENTHNVPLSRFSSKMSFDKVKIGSSAHDDSHWSKE